MACQNFTKERFNSIKNPTYIKAQSPEDLKVMLFNMKHIITPESFKFTGEFLPNHIKDYYTLNQPIFESIALRPDGNKTFTDAKELQIRQQQRKDLFNTIDIFSACGLPSDIINEIVSHLPKAGLPVAFNSVSSGIIAKANILKENAPKEGNRIDFFSKSILERIIEEQNKPVVKGI